MLKLFHCVWFLAEIEFLKIGYVQIILFYYWHILYDIEMLSTANFFLSVVGILFKNIKKVPQSFCRTDD